MKKSRLRRAKKRLRHVLEYGTFWGGEVHKWQCYCNDCGTPIGWTSQDDTREWQDFFCEPCRRAKYARSLRR